nr:hypothetical protein [uncultured Draconibacterium sp.]
MAPSTSTSNEDSTITLERLYKARYYCTYFMSEDKVSRVKLLPIFERLEREIAIKKEQERLLAKALAIANIPFKHT